MTDFFNGYWMDLDLTMASFQPLKKDMKNKILILLILMLHINHISGMDVLPPENLEVNISDGEVIALWKTPAEAPSNFSYNVQMTGYAEGKWTDVSHCTRIRTNYCHLSSLIDDYGSGYKVRVQLITGARGSKWISKKFLPNDSELLPPSINLWATSSTLTVSVHEKPILKKLFPYGVTYTIYLQEIGEENKTTTAYLRDEENQRNKTFTALQWGREYCVSIKVEGNGGLHPSTVSKQQCLHLPEQEWYIIATSSLSVLGALAGVAIIGSIILCYLLPSVKTPVSLKSPVSGWLPLSVAEGNMEVVTDKGWFLYSYGMEVKNCVEVPVTQLTATDNKEEEDRRTSMDSGVGIESNSVTTNERIPPMRQDDSGCGSLGGLESSNCCQTDYPMKDEMTDSEPVRKSEDSGMGMNCQLELSSMSLDGKDRVQLLQSVTGSNYRSQSPAAEQKIHVYNDEDIFTEIPTESILAEVVTGYRAGPESCICSGAGQCSWCHHKTKTTNQYRGVCIENELPDIKTELLDSYESTFSGYPSEKKLDTIMISDIDTSFLQISKAFPLLTSVPLVKCGQDFNMNNVSLSLCDIELSE